MKRFFHILICSLVLLAESFAATSAKTSTNVILITVDTVRADRLGCYGAKDLQTPTLDGLARDGIVFERAISQVPLTWPSHAAILTGMYPFQNGVQDFTGQPLDPHIKSVAQAFKERGYATGAVVSAFVLDRSWGLARGFDFYDDAFAPEAFQHRDLGLVDRKAGESVTRAIRWLSKTPHRPFFFWLHLYDPHSPYDPPEPYHTRYRGHLYDGEIAYADHELGRLIAYLKQNHLYDRSLIVFLSDHGESLGEHGEHEHGFFVYNSTVHIPLIVKPPVGSGFHADRVSAPVETTDVAPTLLQLSGIKNSIGNQFHSQGLLTKKARKDGPAYSETLYTFSSFGWSPLHALETSRYQYIDAPEPELYDVVNDPEEKANLAPQQTAMVAVMKDKLQTLLNENPFKPETAGHSGLSLDADQKLRSLGYFGFRAAISLESIKGGLADPKDKLSEFNTILKAEDALQEREDDQAESLLRQVQEQDPDIYVIPFLLGESALRRGSWERAADQLQRCLALNPNFDNAMTGLAHALSKLGRVDEAKGWLQKALQINPENYRAWYETGLLEADTNPAKAQSAYQKANGIQPNFAPGQRELGMVLFRQKNYFAAATHLEKALALGLDDAHIHNFLGICYSQTNRVQRSIESYQSALKLDPTMADAHFNLAYELSRAQMTNQARAEYTAACQLETKFCSAIPK
ncbi:MAG: hypothetical protein NVS1B11_19150 [Terriglobales bacterium]